MEIEYEREARERGNAGLENGAIIDFAKEGRRMTLVSEYSWAIPSEEALQTIASHGPVLEIGAGNGYWAWELEKRGVDVVAYDPEPYAEGQFIELGANGVPLRGDEKKLIGLPGVKVYRKEWAKVRKGDHTVVTAEEHRGRNLLLCWPSWGGAWATQAVEHCYAEVVFHVGEIGGCTGDDDLIPTLSRNFKLVKNVEIPQYVGIHDSLTVWQR